jgi:hypothetical protein
MDSSACAQAELQLSGALRARAFRMTEIEDGDFLLLVNVLHREQFRITLP